MTNARAHALARINLITFLSCVKAMHNNAAHAAQFAIFAAQQQAMYETKSKSNNVVDDIANYIVANTEYNMSQLLQMGDDADMCGTMFMLDMLLQVSTIDEMLIDVAL